MNAENGLESIDNWLSQQSMDEQRRTQHTLVNCTWRLTGRMPRTPNALGAPIDFFSIIIERWQSW